jgi:hypothetical protein
VATGFAAQGQNGGVSRLSEPAAGELKVARAAPPGSGSRRQGRRGSLAVDELEVPEFIPNL